MIVQVVSPTDFTAGAPAFDGGSAYAVRIVQFSAGATIAFDNPKSTRKIYGYFAYRNALRTGWKQIYLTGSCVVEIATSPDESFGGSGVAGVNAIDGNQNTIVVGAAAEGAPLSGAPVLVAGRDNAGNVRALPVPFDANGRSNNVSLVVGGIDGGGLARTVPVAVLAAAAPANALLVGGKDGTGNMQPLPVLQTGGVNPGLGVMVGGVNPAATAFKALQLDGNGSVAPAVDTKDFGGVSPAAASTVLGAAYALLTIGAGFRRAQFLFRVQGATGGTLDIYLQTSFDNGATWIDVAHLPQLAAAAALVAYAVVLQADSGVPAAPLASLNTADGTPTLTVNTTRNLIGNLFRVVYVAGAGTSAGGVQVIKAIFS